MDYRYFSAFVISADADCAIIFSGGLYISGLVVAFVFLKAQKPARFFAAFGSLRIFAALVAKGLLFYIFLPLYSPFQHFFEVLRFIRRASPICCPCCKSVPTER